MNIRGKQFDLPRPSPCDLYLITDKSLFDIVNDLCLYHKTISTLAGSQSNMSNKEIA